MGAVSKDSSFRSGWRTAARDRVQRPRATSAKSIRARSLRPREMSRFRRPMSMSMHNTRCPAIARAAATPPVTEVLPVPPLPEATAMTIPMKNLLSHQIKVYHKSVSRQWFSDKNLSNAGEKPKTQGNFPQKCGKMWTKSHVTGALFGSWPIGGGSPSGWGPPFPQ